MPESGARCSGYKDEFSGVLVLEEVLLQSGQFPCSLLGPPQHQFHPENQEIRVYVQDG